MSIQGTSIKNLCNKRILLGISGGIAAYKCADLTRQLKTAGADVRVVLTPAASEFITALTLQALSGNPVHQQLLDPEAEAGMGHIELARWADLILIAPASADLIARLASGMGNDLLTTLCLAADAPMVLAPAMNQAMWRDQRTQDNIKRLSQLNMTILDPAVGEQACGDVGPGRMQEPAELVQACAALFDTGTLAGLHVVITAGPTREALDPVRYISNHSSGKMGYAIAEAAVAAGAKVTLVSGPVNLSAPDFVDCKNVDSAGEMLAACLNEIDSCDIFIAAAAVADYRPVVIANQKLKKNHDEMIINMIKNPDIVATVANHEQKPFTVGFAAETQNVIGYARDKLKRKNLDMLIANDVSQPGIGFNSDDNAVTVISNNHELSIAKTSKSKLARQLIDLIAKSYAQSAAKDAPKDSVQ